MTQYVDILILGVWKIFYGVYKFIYNYFVHLGRLDIMKNSSSLFKMPLQVWLQLTKILSLNVHLVQITDM